MREFIQAKLAPLIATDKDVLVYVLLPEALTVLLAQTLSVDMAAAAQMLPNDYATAPEMAARVENIKRIAQQADQRRRG